SHRHDCDTRRKSSPRRRVTAFLLDAGRDYGLAQFSPHIGMPSTPLHCWDLTPGEAIEVQQRLRNLVRLQPLARPVSAIACAAIPFNKFSETVYARIVVLSLPDLRMIESAGVRSVAKFPYVPGLLSFRETPSLLEAWEKLKTKPDVLMLDGQGIAY